MSAANRTENLRRLLAPRHVAFIGGRYAVSAMERCAQFGFGGELWLVNPKATEAKVGQVFASVDDLPVAPDATYLAVSSEKTIDTVRRLAERGAGGCICFAAGFAEKGGEGVAMEAALAEMAGDMALLGPNCYGILDLRSRLHLWTGEMLEPYAGPGIAVVSQSGALAEFMTMEARSVPFVFIGSVGNQAVVSLEEMMEAVLDDETINAVGIYVEGIRDIAHFSRVAEKAADKRIPIVAIKVGRSQAATQITLGHTSSLAGTPELYDALFERLGIIRADTLSQFLESLKMLSVVGPINGPRLAAITISGGEAALIADYAPGLGLTLPPLSPDQVKVLEAGLPDMVNVMNPLDTTVGTMGNLDQQALIFDVITRGEFDVVATMMETYENPAAPFTGEMDLMMEQMEIAVRRNGMPGVVVSALPEALPLRVRRRAIQSGMAPLQGLDDMMFAIAASHRYGEFLKGRRGRALAVPASPHQSGEARVLNEWESKQWLADHGVVIPEGRVVAPHDAPEAAESLGFPVVMKAVSDELMHKTEAGAIALGLSDYQAVSDALDRLQQTLGGSLEHVLVERMIEEAVAELIVGIKFDAAFGHALVVGAGGVLVELVSDTTTLLLPTDRDAVTTALHSLKVSKLLHGFRGRPEGDRDAVIATILAIADFAMSERKRLVEVDVNPLLVLPRGRGTVAVDALIRVVE